MFRVSMSSFSEVGQKFKSEPYVAHRSIFHDPCLLSFGILEQTFTYLFVIPI